MDTDNLKSIAALAAMLGVSPEDAVLDVKSARSRDRKDNRICACGHNARSHTEFGVTEVHEAMRRSGRTMCTPGRVDCKCKVFHHVLDVTSSRPFIYRGLGSHQDHALIRGITSLVSSGGSFKYSETMSCFKCGSVEESYIPAYINIESGKIIQEPSRGSVMLCNNCYIELSAE